MSCRRCRVLLYRKRFDRAGGVCPECGWHSPLTAGRRLATLVDRETAVPVRLPDTVHDPLSFVDLEPYAGRLAKARAQTGLDDAVQVVRGTIQDRPVVAAVMDFRFLGGSLGTAAGEAVAVAAETALADGVPLLLVTASGGARMQEGTLSLMQMAKTANGMAELDEAGLLTVSLITDPTYGGVAASFATLSDILIAEPGARMGFAGPRVIEQTIREKLPQGFQTAEFLLEHGLIDGVRPRAELPYLLGTLLSAAAPPAGDRGGAAPDVAVRDPADLAGRPVEQTVRLARELGRPTTLDHVAEWTDRFVELRGDRMGGDCPAIVGGLAVLDGLPLMVIGHQKGHTTDELIRRNFGMPTPAGYRKAMRLMRLAAKLRIPVVTLIDTPGAYPGLEAEERGQAGTIAECIRLMGSLPVPVVSVVTGEGGSGGALALGVANEVLMCENSIYSVISPEGCAAILWRSPEAAHTAAAALKVDAGSTLELGIVDGVIPEPDGGAHRDPAAASRLVRLAVTRALRDLRGRDGTELVAQRRLRYRRFGSADTSLQVKGILP
ncbi:acetyl-CoA carboxylase carboxyl transferase subunit alpha [Nonomuraea polychroma]|nr:acetyl-CoA carboxylase carboxyl transferase subunit alpha [Nonomuraea polychroma]